MIEVVGSQHRIIGIGELSIFLAKWIERNQVFKRCLTDTLFLCTHKDSRINGGVCIRFNGGGFTSHWGIL